MDEVLTNVPDVSTCWAACEFKPNCAYFVYYGNNNGGENTCNLYLPSATVNYKCDIIRGPSGQDYDVEVSFSKYVVSNLILLL